MKKREAVFRSLLAGPILDFLAHKRALKRRYATEEAALRLFDRYLVEQGVTNIASITPELIEAFLASRRRGQPRSYNHLLGVLRRLFDWLVFRTQCARLPSVSGRAVVRRREPHSCSTVAKSDDSSISPPRCQKTGARLNAARRTR